MAKKTAVLVGYEAPGEPAIKYGTTASNQTTTSSQASFVPARAFWKKKPANQASVASVASLRAVLPEPVEPRGGRTVSAWLEQHRRHGLNIMNDGRWFSTRPSPTGLFSKLPKNVREKIWGYAVSYPSDFVITSYRGDSKLSYYRSLVPRRDPPSSVGFPAKEDDVRALTFVSQQIHQETNNLFYKLNTFGFPHDSQVRGNDVHALLAGFKSQIGKEAFSHIDRLNFYSHTITRILSNRAHQMRLIAKITSDLQSITSSTRAHCLVEQKLAVCVSLSLDIGGLLVPKSTIKSYVDPNHASAGVFRELWIDHAGIEYHNVSGWTLELAGMYSGRQRVAMDVWFSGGSKGIENLESALREWDVEAEREKERLTLGSEGRPVHSEKLAQRLAHERARAIKEGVRCLRAVRDGILTKQEGLRTEAPVFGKKAA